MNQRYLSNIKSDHRLYDLHLADDYSDHSFIVDILLGAEAAFRFLGNLSDSQSEPVIQESRFGHVLSGPLSKLSQLTKDTSISIHEMSTAMIDLPFTNEPNSSLDYDISFGNLLSNSSLFIHVKRLFQHQFVSEPTTAMQTNEFLYSY